MKAWKINAIKVYEVSYERYKTQFLDATLEENEEETEYPFVRICFVLRTNFGLFKSNIIGKKQHY